MAKLTYVLGHQRLCMSCKVVRRQHAMLVALPCVYLGNHSPSPNTKPWIADDSVGFSRPCSAQTDLCGTTTLDERKIRE